MTTDYIITFTSSQQALRAESLLGQSGITSRLITAPRAISSECGFCLLVKKTGADDLATELKDMAVEYSHIYIRQKMDGVTRYAQQN
jgi:hypothetical protein